MENYLRELLLLSIRQEASDVLISANCHPVFRINRVLVPLVKEKTLSPQETIAIANVLMNERQREKLLREKEVDFSYSLDDIARFRVNVFFQRGTVSCALRLIPSRIRTIEELNLPPVLHEFARPSQGFILITGPSGHGKSTTLAAIIDEINHNRSDHIITIEDPIEYVFKNDRSIIEQREVYQDTTSFAKALRSSFRQDPNVIMVGEMRDQETMSVALSAAETGHLVFATLHTNDAAQTIHRIVDSFPSEQQAQVRSQLAAALFGIFSQRLIRGIKGDLVPAYELLFATPAVANLIRENKIHEIPLVIETSAEMGMVSLNRSLATLVKMKKVSLENALIYSLNPTELKLLIKK